MAQADNLYIHEYRPDRRTPIVPLGFLRMPKMSPANSWARSTLVDLRGECIKRGYMKDDDEFLIFANSTKMVYPIAIIDEESFNVADYLAQATGDKLIYVRRKGVVGGPAFEEQRYRERSFVDDSRTLSSTVTPNTEPYLAASYSLNRWKPQTISCTYSIPEDARSYTMIPLSDSLQMDATFTALVRTEGDGHRVAFSVESALRDKSLFYVGTCKESRIIEYYSFVSDVPLALLGFVIEDDPLKAWPRLTLVFNVTGRKILLYVNGRLAKQEAIPQDYPIEYLKASRLVLGHSKNAGSWDGSWTGDIADIRVWEYAMDETEIGTLAATVPDLAFPSRQGS